MAVATIIGGAGRMGEWFAGFLKRSGYQVIISDKDESAARRLARKRGLQFIRDQTQALRLAQIVILTTPTQVTLRILKQIEWQLARRTLVVEISSVKEPLRDTLQEIRRRGVPILSIHPMFGPGAKTLEDKTVIVIKPSSRNPQARRLLSLLRRQGARIVKRDLDNHDRLAAITLSLSHFLNISFANTLRAMSADPNRSREVAGTTFKLQLLTAEEIYQDAPETELSILMDNKHSIEVLKKFIQQCSAALEIVEKGERKRMLRNLSDGYRFISRDRTFPSAYKRFNAAIEGSNLA